MACFITNLFKLLIQILKILGRDCRKEEVKALKGLLWINRTSRLYRLQLQEKNVGNQFLNFGKTLCPSLR